MVNGFTRSKEGEAEYKKLGLPYPEEVFDGLYEQWLKDTSAEDLDKYTKHSEKEVTMFTRLRTGDGGGKEFLLYSFVHYRLDQALNVRHMWRPLMGMYPIPMPIYKTTIASFGKQHREISEINAIDKGYSIPFTKQNLDKIKEMGLEYDGKINYLLQVSNGLKTSVATYEDLRNGDFDELAHFGRIPTPTQRQRWIDEKGLEKDQQWQKEMLRRKTEGDIPQKSVTAEQVREIVKQEQEQEQQEQSESTNTSKPTKAKGKKTKK